VLGSFAPPHRAVTVGLITLAALLAAAAVLIGINDNLPGIILAALAGALFVTAFVHHWRSPKRFLMFGAISLGVVFGVGLVGIGIDISVTANYLHGPLAMILETTGSTLFVVIAFLGVPSVLIGLIGGFVAWMVGRRK
jgi:hypothetical protein